MDSIIMELDGFTLANSKVLLVSTANTKKKSMSSTSLLISQPTITCPTFQIHSVTQVYSAQKDQCFISEEILILIKVSDIAFQCELYNKKN